MLAGEIRSTGGWNVYRAIELGTVKLTQGKHAVTLTRAIQRRPP